MENNRNADADHPGARPRRQGLVFASILRAQPAMVCSKACSNWFLAPRRRVYRDHHETLEAVEYFKAPESPGNGAAGHRRRPDARNWKLLSIAAIVHVEGTAPSTCASFRVCWRGYPQFPRSASDALIFTASIDSHLNENGWYRVWRCRGWMYGTK
jgi:hypothetical protein